MSDDDLFMQKCYVHASRTIMSMSLELTHQLVTQSKEWGAVWRADYTFPDKDTTSLVNRMMCWEQGGKLFFMSSIGQNVPPLCSSRGEAS